MTTFDASLYPRLKGATILRVGVGDRRTASAAQHLSLSTTIELGGRVAHGWADLRRDDILTVHQHFKLDRRQGLLGKLQDRNVLAALAWLLASFFALFGMALGLGIK